MKLSLCNTGLRKPLSTRHTTTGPRTQNTYIQIPQDSLSYISPTNQIPAQRRRMEAVQLYTDLRHSTCLTIILLALESTTQPTIPAPSYLPSTLPWARYYVCTSHKNNQYTSVRSRLLASSLLTNPCLLSLWFNPSLSHKSPPFALLVFSR